MYDDFTLPPYPTNTTIDVNFQLVNSKTGVPVPLQSTQAVFDVTLESHDTNTPPNPVYTIVETNFSIVPRAPLDSVDNKYTVVITQTHTEGPNVISDNTNDLGPQQLLYFNSELYFGSLLTYFTNVNSAPVITNTVLGSHLDVLLAVTTNSGILPGAPGHFYGNGSNIAVSLATDGTATALGGQTVTVQGPPVDIAGISNVLFGRTGVTLSSNGATGTLTVGYPVGFTTAFPTNLIRWTVSAFVAAGLPLNQNLNPASNIVTYPFTVYGIQENLPVCFSVPSIQWVVNSGEFIMNPTSALFVRELEDNLLTTNTALLANPNAARRVSNDGYYRNVNVQPGSQLIVAADSNGVAQVTCQLALNPPELRPHFPYSGNGNGQEIQTGTGGMLIISNNLISSNSFLPVSAPVPLEYARTCGDTNCSPQLGAPATLAFTPSNNVLGFNTDGGLLAYGTVPPTNLTWGYDGGTHYAQQAYTIQNGAYEMAGTFLLGGQSSLDPTDLAAGLLLTGWSDGTNSSYAERPGTGSYDSGFANYPGFNIRAPTTGNSYIAEQVSGPYPLDGRSKYYARYSGVSGIHESASFPSSLTLYGYDFTFTSYRLSFLDSDVDQSRTDGAIAFPTNPSGFDQGFQDMKFSCTGDLESADVPPDSPPDHLNYWNVNITPESIQFQPSTNDLCGTGNRWLVLGVETLLPFIPQKLQASLGFQPSGNLVTPADGVAGTDSRFPIPGQLSLQGPGGDVYPLSTCAEGYFNNYDTSGAPPNGFYNIAGRLRVPFFEDIKVHLHVMPTGSNTAQIAIMGGWPFAGSGASDMGWSVNNSNYFNEKIFDPHSDGFPTGAGISGYENSPNTMYRAVAQRNWIEVAIFDYPLQFNTVTREFAGFQDAPVLAANYRRE